eukprot:TRINITY_DN16943_c0_g1_i1.p1 TRINITY_DN16943_c0_g1~~TRINITY_DN16943_c0_g1_i1.p1  ORF type:complete len:340 (-),score=72.74 TRINITY_DN16943_c0_g1_i1:7-978(-)
MVDYRKWDKLDLSDDEDEPRKPQVTKFDGPQSVTIGSGGAVPSRPVAQQPGESAAPAADGAAAVDDEGDDEPMEPSEEDLALAGPDADFREDALQCRALGERAMQRGDVTEGLRLLEKALRLDRHLPGLEDMVAAARRQHAAALAPAPVPRAAADPGAAVAASGGEVAGRYCWSQTRESVEVNIYVPDGTKAKSVSASVTETNVDVKVDGKSVFAGEWEFKVEPDEDPDWEMREVNGRRAIRLTIQKAPIRGGFSVIVWWKRVLKGDPEIDVAKISDRKPGKSEGFAKAWEEAHAMFKEKAKHREKIQINVGGAADDDAEMAA